MEFVIKHSLSEELNTFPIYLVPVSQISLILLDIIA